MKTKNGFLSFLHSEIWNSTYLQTLLENQHIPWRDEEQHMVLHTECQNLRHLLQFYTSAYKYLPTNSNTTLYISTERQSILHNVMLHTITQQNLIIIVECRSHHVHSDYIKCDRSCWWFLFSNNSITGLFYFLQFSNWMPILQTYDTPPYPTGWKYKQNLI